MFSYMMFGTNNLPAAIAFYDPLMEILGHPQGGRSDEGASWGTFGDNNTLGFCIGRPFNQEPATVANGVMAAFNTPDPATIQRLHALALSLGGTDEGAPGYRPHYGEGFYSAYVRDPDGNKLAFVYYDAKA
ncbi:VOC family protein [Enterobacillus tribolii]|uniref:Catechol 2,3-dioxygenase-like lactoylglutathione lyase family enzyme n=1 Tax=Enterobacillus tribolii TaxID=1487935 RepID=A0A370QHX5_9GAMM|nr:VOC family protein [Enterobacillus tribolii]MBW7982673.1 VOC family protein [Enterobacillus tribolii]RDK87952.1 catechol 2,3-dioxygenase-like lactoylglutathione lyase family enzyme [Enterobacillus tribolii]